MPLTTPDSVTTRSTAAVTSTNCVRRRVLTRKVSIEISPAPKTQSAHQYVNAGKRSGRRPWRAPSECNSRNRQRRPAETEAHCILLSLDVLDFFRPTMSNRLQNKVILVTGAAQGIGFACARQAAAEGATVVLADIQQDRGEKSAAAIRNQGGKANFHPVDVRDESQCATLIDHTIREHKKLDGMVNNAGWFPRATLEQTTTQLWEEVLNVNLRSAFYMCKYAVPPMRKARAGSIVNMGSICGIQSLPNLVAYGA